MCTTSFLTVRHPEETSPVLRGWIGPLQAENQLLWYVQPFAGSTSPPCDGQHGCFAKLGIPFGWCPRGYRKGLEIVGLAAILAVCRTRVYVSTAFYICSGWQQNGYVSSWGFRLPRMGFLLISLEAKLTRVPKAKHPNRLEVSLALSSPFRSDPGFEPAGSRARD